MATKTATAQPAALQIDRVAAEMIRVPIVGTAPLIVSRFSEKQKRLMLEAQQGRKKLREVRDPEAEYQAAFYRIKEEGDTSPRYGFPVIGFKAAMISATRLYDRSVSMTLMRQIIFMNGLMTDADQQHLFEIHGEPRMREDVVRLAGSSRSADLRFRPEFPVWSAELTIIYVASLVSQASVLSLIDAGGLGVGIGEWRPEHDGEFGTFAIDQSRPVEVLS